MDQIYEIPAPEDNRVLLYRLVVTMRKKEVLLIDEKCNTNKSFEICKQKDGWQYDK